MVRVREAYKPQQTHDYTARCRHWLNTRLFHIDALEDELHGNAEAMSAAPQRPPELRLSASALSAKSQRLAARRDEEHADERVAREARLAREPAHAAAERKAADASVRDQTRGHAFEWQSDHSAAGSPPPDSSKKRDACRDREESV